MNRLYVDNSYVLEMANMWDLVWLLEGYTFSLFLYFSSWIPNTSSSFRPDLELGFFSTTMYLFRDGKRQNIRGSVKGCEVKVCLRTNPLQHRELYLKQLRELWEREHRDIDCGEGHFRTYNLPHDKQRLWNSATIAVGQLITTEWLKEEMTEMSEVKQNIIHYLPLVHIPESCYSVTCWSCHFLSLSSKAGAKLFVWATKAR